jgi:hypothetical protein
MDSHNQSSFPSQLRLPVILLRLCCLNQLDIRFGFIILTVNVIVIIIVCVVSFRIV